MGERETNKRENPSGWGGGERERDRQERKPTERGGGGVEKPEDTRGGKRERARAQQRARRKKMTRQNETKTERDRQTDRQTEREIPARRTQRQRQRGKSIPLTDGVRRLAWLCQLGNREERTPQVDSVHKPGRPQGTKWSEARALGTEAVMHVPHENSTQSLSASRCVCD